MQYVTLRHVSCTASQPGTEEMRMKRSGFTTIEMIIVVVIIGVIAAIGFPKIRGTLDKTNVRSARVYLSTQLVTACATAVQRGCYAVVHFTSGASGAIWVTACPRRMPGAGTVDTIGGVESLADRSQVTLTATGSTDRMDPRGLSTDGAGVPTTVRPSAHIAPNRASTLIHPPRQ